MATNPRNAYLSGLALSAATDRLTLIVGAGLCYLPGGNATLRMATDAPVSVALSQPAANTWQHVYAYLADLKGTVAVEASQTAPSDPYQGTARTKVGDTTRRYLGSVYVGADAKVVPFLHSSPGQQGNEITYTAPLGQSGSAAPVLLGIVNTVQTFNCANFVPPNVRKMFAQLDNTSGARLYIGNADMGSTLTATNYLLTLAGNNDDYLEVLLDASRAFQYLYGGSLLNLTGGLYVRARGFNFDR